MLCEAYNLTWNIVDCHGKGLSKGVTWSLLHVRSLWLQYTEWFKEGLRLKANFRYQVRNEGLSYSGDSEKS